MPSSNYVGGTKFKKKPVKTVLSRLYNQKRRDKRNLTWSTLNIDCNIHVLLSRRHCSCRRDTHRFGFFRGFDEHEAWFPPRFFFSSLIGVWFLKICQTGPPVWKPFLRAFVLLGGSSNRRTDANALAFIHCTFKSAARRIRQRLLFFPSPGRLRVRGFQLCGQVTLT